SAAVSGRHGTLTAQEWKPRFTGRDHRWEIQVPGRRDTVQAQDKIKTASRYRTATGMPLPDQEIRRLFDKLASQLRERGAATIVEQVIDEITQGKQIIYKTLPRRSDTRQLHRPESEEAVTDRGGRREYAETLQYSPAERLDLLLQALERAIIDAGAIDSDLAKNYRSVRFLPEQEEENVRTFRVGALVNVGAISASADNDRFEAYVWSIVVRAAMAESAAVTYRDPNKNQVYDLLFRTSPGSISSKAPPFIHALIQFPGKPELEAHIGIKIQ